MKQMTRFAIRGLLFGATTLMLLAGCRETDQTLLAPTSEASSVQEQRGEQDTPSEAPADTVEVAESETATPAPTSTPTPTNVAATATPEPPPAVEVAAATPTTSATTETASGALLLDDDFRDSKSGWPEGLSFDNYYVGYHEPEWYHVELQTPNDHVPVVLEGETFADVSVEADIFLLTALSTDSGEFRHGLVLRRSGKLFYAFAISPRSGRWAVLKSSPAGLETLAEGSNETISSPEESDSLRVDAIGSTFVFYINGEMVSELEDGDYKRGELGFFVQTLDAERVHVHYDSLRVAVPRDNEILLSDNFRDSESGWPAARSFDNYYIGYHEPEWYHVEVQSEAEYVPVELEGETFADVTVEAEIFVETPLSAETGEFRYGLVLRRSGRQYYAFTVNPKSGEWAVLKNSATRLETLAEGSEPTIRGLEEADLLRVDAAGSRFLFHINGNLVTDLQDDDYAAGALGFFVQTFDSPRVHVHYDSLTVREANVPAPTCTVIARSLNLRPGPGVAFTPVRQVLAQGTRLTALARSNYPWWIRVEVTETGENGWVYAAPQYASCNFDLADLPQP